MKLLHCYVQNIYYVFFRGSAKAGETVLVHGASGGVSDSVSIAVCQSDLHFCELVAVYFL